MLFQSAKAAEPVKVFIIDTGVDRLHPALANYTVACNKPEDCKDSHGHGTQITSLIVNGILREDKEPETPVSCKNLKIEMCNYFPADDDQNYYSCLKRAVQFKPTFVNFSSTAKFPSVTEYSLIQAVLKTGAVFVAATGNESSNLLENPVYPIMYMHTDRLAFPFNQLKSLKGIVPVAARTFGGSFWGMSNRIDGMVTEPGSFIHTADKGGSYVRISGTSAAAALHTNRLIRNSCND